MPIRLTYFTDYKDSTANQGVNIRTTEIFMFQIGKIIQTRRWFRFPILWIEDTAKALGGV